MAPPYQPKPTYSSPHSSDADDKQETTSALSRLNLDDVPTVTSTTAKGSGSRRGLRARANTSPERHQSSTSLTCRQRSDTNTQSQHRPHRLDLSSIASRPLLREPLPILPEATPDKPSAPIPIPPRKRNPILFSPTGTPLTARVPPGEYFNIDEPLKPRPHISQSLTPYYSSGSKKMSNNQSPPNVQRGFKPVPPRSGAQPYTPTSPLSPTSPNQGVSSSNRQKDRRPAQNLNLSGLPRFHPANFPSKDSSPASVSHRPSRSITSQPRPGRGSDAQQKLQQYQRDLVANAGKYAKPSPPRLTPMMSPGEPMTPLMLEGHGDYMLAGSSALASGLKASEGREYVECLVQKENERRSHPEARPDSLSPGSSPAVSPAA